MHSTIVVIAGVILTLNSVFAKSSIFFFRTRSMVTSLEQTTLPSNMDPKEFLQFYDPITNETLNEPMVGPLTTRSVDHRVNAAPRTTTARPPGGWFSNIRRPCSCAGLQCGCCAGVDFKRLNFRRQCKYCV